MTDEFERPFDALNDMEDERVRVRTKDGSKIVGTLHAFDKHINMALKDVELYPEGKKGYFVMNQYFQRGDSVVSVEPQKIEEEGGGE